jgi:hypothetical protein
MTDQPFSRSLKKGDANCTSFEDSYSNYLNKGQYCFRILSKPYIDIQV